MKRTLFLVVLIILTLSIKAQTTIVYGEMVDSVSRQGEPNASIRVFKEGKMDKPVAMSITDVNGKFRQSIKGIGGYIICFSSTGRKEIRRKVILKKEGGEINIGTLLVHDDTKQLKGVDVVAQKPLIKMETDKMTYDVQADNDSKSNTVLDMLRKVPMVVVDGQDNIMVNGSGSFKVYVDGKPNIMFSSNPSQIFKSMPASAVKKIEVITNPGAKYDAEGTAGVLNLIMSDIDGKKQKTNGYNGNILGQVNSLMFMGAAFLSGQQGKFTYNTNISYLQSFPADGNITTNRINKTDGSKMFYDQSGKMMRGYSVGNVNLGYDIDSLSNIGLTLSIFRLNDKRYGPERTMLSGGSYGKRFEYSADIDAKSTLNTINTSIDYQRFFNKERTKSITLSYLFNYTPSKNEMRRLYKSPSTPIPFPLKDLYSLSVPYDAEHTMQLDYTMPIGKTQTLSTGLKYINRTNDSDSKYYDIISGKDIYNEKNSTNYKNKQDIMAGYAEYSGSFGKFGSKVGVRYEHTWENVKFLKGHGEDFKKSYSNIVPSMSITYNIKAATNIGLNYNMRIARPMISSLNPYIDRTNPRTLSFGNPDLDVEKTHSISIVFNSFTPKFMLNMTLSGVISNNEIQQYNFIKDNILHSTYGNIVCKKGLSMNSFINYSLSTKTRVFMIPEVSYYDFRSNMSSENVSSEHNYGWGGKLFMGVQQTLPWKIESSLFGGANFKSYSLEGDNGAFSMIAMSLTKNLFKDRLNITLSYFTPLTGRLHYKVNTYNNSFSQKMITNISIQNVGLTIKWNFGNTKRQFIDHKSKINNDYNKEINKSEAPGMGIGNKVGM